MANPFRGTVNVRVNEKITLDHLQSIVARVAGLAGCPHCGLLGIDLRLGGDPPEAAALRELAGVSDVAFGA